MKEKEQQVTQVKNVPPYSLIFNKSAFLSPSEDEYAAGNLFLGGHRALTKQFITTHDIRAVLTVMDLKSYNKLNIAKKVQDFDCVEQHLFIDSLDNATAQITPYFQQTNAFIDSALSKEEGSIYVHCKGGYSRSPAILSAFLIWKTGKPLQDIEKILKERRNCIAINEGFKQQLKQYGQQIIKGQ